MNSVILESTLVCPVCGHRKTEQMSSVACLPIQRHGKLQAVANNRNYSYTFVMRLLSLFLVTLLCVAIPLQGIARVVVIEETPCPAQSAAMTTVDTADDHDCCNDADTVAKTGKPCKAEQDCQSASPGMINQTESRLSPTVSTEKTPPPSTFALTFDPSATWRPPTQA